MAEPLSLVVRIDPDRRGLAASVRGPVTRENLAELRDRLRGLMGTGAVGVTIDLREADVYCPMGSVLAGLRELATARGVALHVRGPGVTRQLARS